MRVDETAKSWCGIPNFALAQGIPRPARDGGERHARGYVPVRAVHESVHHLVDGPVPAHAEQLRQVVALQELPRVATVLSDHALRPHPRVLQDRRHLGAEHAEGGAAVRRWVDDDQELPPVQEESAAGPRAVAVLVRLQEVGLQGGENPSSVALHLRPRAVLQDQDQFLSPARGLQESGHHGVPHHLQTVSQGGHSPFQTPLHQFHTYQIVELNVLFLHGPLG